MRINNPEAKGLMLARILQIGMLLGCLALLTSSNYVTTIDSSGSQGEYKTGPTEEKDPNYD